MRVLLVEDDRELAEYVRKGLEEEGYVVQVCFDGSAGLKAAEITAFDIIVHDEHGALGALDIETVTPNGTIGLRQIDRRQLGAGYSAVFAARDDEGR